MVDRIGVHALFLRALEAGARQLGPFECEWEISGNCLMPVRRDAYARKGRGMQITKWDFSPKSVDRLEDTFEGGVATAERPLTRVYGRDKKGPYVVHLTVRCRMCDNCLDERRKLWARRAVFEQAVAARTWLGTLTLTPQYHSLFGMKAAERWKRRGNGELESAPYDTQLHARHAIIGAEVQKMLKRMRKAGHAFRYMLVLEAHVSGLPHYHMLLHERGAPMRKAYLDTVWPFGFCKWKLADDTPRAAWYAAKYLGKSSAARIRASLKYGGEMALAVALPSFDQGERDKSSSREGEPPSTGSLLSNSQNFLENFEALDV